PVGGAPAAGGLRRPGAHRRPDAARHPSDGAGSQPARRGAPGLAGHAGDARDPAQVPMTANSVPANSGRLPMDIRPILSTLSRHKTAAALIVFEIALSCAIICNALFL